MTTDPIAAARALIEPLTRYGNPKARGAGSLQNKHCADAATAIATLADALEAERAKVAAAYETAAKRCYEDQGRFDTPDRIRALTTADAESALNKMLAEARLEGWRAGRDAAAEICDGTAKYHMSDPDDIEVVRLTAAEIRALPEPKEASHE